jgi:hypothetical protein
MANTTNHRQKVRFGGWSSSGLPRRRDGEKNAHSLSFFPTFASYFYSEEHIAACRPYGVGSWTGFQRGNGLR